MKRAGGWRGGILGRILRIHSPSAHYDESCWCKGTKHEIFPAIWTKSQVLALADGYRRFFEEMYLLEGELERKKAEGHFEEAQRVFREAYGRRPPPEETE